MDIITDRLKETFCKNYNINIKIFKEPYFTQRLKLFEPQYGAYTKWLDFLSEIKEFKTEKEYVTYYQKIRNNVIKYISSKKEYIKLQELDETKYQYDIDEKVSSIYKDNNDGKVFLSIDLRKACYNSLKYIDTKLVDDTETYEEFISKFTNKRHLINSKRYRQTIFGMLEPNKQKTIEKYLMKGFYEIIKTYEYDIVDFTHDEIIIQLPFDYKSSIDVFKTQIYRYADQNNIDIRIDIFKIFKFKKTKAFIKVYLNKKKVDVKCATHIELPIILRLINNQDVQEEDYFVQIKDKITKITLDENKIPNLKKIKINYKE